MYKVVTLRTEGFECEAEERTRLINVITMDLERLFAEEQLLSAEKQLGEDFKCSWKGLFSEGGERNKKLLKEDFFNLVHTGYLGKSADVNKFIKSKLTLLTLKDNKEIPQDQKDKYELEISYIMELLNKLSSRQDGENTESIAKRNSELVAILTGLPREIKSIIMQAVVKSKNGRVFLRNIMQALVKSKDAIAFLLNLSRYADDGQIINDLVKFLTPTVMQMLVDSIDGRNFLFNSSTSYGEEDQELEVQRMDELVARLTLRVVQTLVDSKKGIGFLFNLSCRIEGEDPASAAQRKNGIVALLKDVPRVIETLVNSEDGIEFLLILSGKIPDEGQEGEAQRKNGIVALLKELPKEDVPTVIQALVNSKNGKKFLRNVSCRIEGEDPASAAQKKNGIVELLKDVPEGEVFTMMQTLVKSEDGKEFLRNLYCKLDGENQASENKRRGKIAGLHLNASINGIYLKVKGKEEMVL